MWYRDDVLSEATGGFYCSVGVDEVSLLCTDGGTNGTDCTGVYAYDTSAF